MPVPLPSNDSLAYATVATSRIHDVESPSSEPEGASKTSESFIETANSQMTLYRELCVAGESPELVEAVCDRLLRTQADLHTMITTHMGEDEASLMALLTANEAVNGLLAAPVSGHNGTNGVDVVPVEASVAVEAPPPPQVSESNRVPESDQCASETPVCPICFEELGAEVGGPVRTLRCGHQFHDGCVSHWLTECPKSTCPVCRDVVAPGECLQCTTAAVGPRGRTLQGAAQQHDHSNSTAPPQMPHQSHAEPLPDGWEAVPSRSRPGEISYLNTRTGRRRINRPTAPARNSRSDSRASRRR